MTRLKDPLYWITFIVCLAILMTFDAMIGSPMWTVIFYIAVGFKMPEIYDWVKEVVIPWFNK